MTSSIRERLEAVPNRPGCYLMRDRRGEIIYIGKAKNLRRRLQSYFRPGARHAPKVRSMVETVWDFDFMTVKNEAEALLTEASLIKRHKPHFNILMRDDKRYLALRADPTAKWPRFACCRIVRDDGATYFGPFPSSPVVRTAKDFVEKRFGIRECDALSPDGETHRHCLADVIRTCSAPCIGRISEQEYRERFEEACAFLKGERPAVIEEVASDMRKAAADGDFERAARLRDTLFALREMTKAHFVRRSPSLAQAEARAGLEELREALGLERPLNTIECVDISNLFGTHSVASLVVARDGLPDRRYYRHFRIRTVEGADDPRSMAEVVRRRYAEGSSLLAGVAARRSFRLRRRHYAAACGKGGFRRIGHRRHFVGGAGGEARGDRVRRRAREFDFAARLACAFRADATARRSPPVCAVLPSQASRPDDPRVGAGRGSGNRRDQEEPAAQAFPFGQGDSEGIAGGCSGGRRSVAGGG